MNDMETLDIDEYIKQENEKRMAYAISEVTKLGYSICHRDEKSFTFEFNGNAIRVFPYRGWFSGKGVKDGRGIRNLLKQIKK